MTVAIQDFWLAGSWEQAPVGGLPYITGVGSVDVDFGFRFVFHGSDWTESFLDQLKAAVPGAQMTVIRYTDGPNSQILVVGNLQVLFSAGSLLLSSGAELTALNTLLGL